MMGFQYTFSSTGEFTGFLKHLSSRRDEESWSDGMVGGLGL